MQAPDAETVQTNGRAEGTKPKGSGLVDDDVVIENCRSAKNAPKFEALFDRGDTSAYGGDASGADYALLGILKFETQDPDQLERLMRCSALARPKWDEWRAGRSWLRYSIDNALKDVGESRTRRRKGVGRYPAIVIVIVTLHMTVTMTMWAKKQRRGFEPHRSRSPRYPSLSAQKRCGRE